MKYTLCPDLYLNFQLPIQGGSSLRSLMSLLFSLSKFHTAGALLQDGAAFTCGPVAQRITSCPFPFVYQYLGYKGEYYRHWGTFGANRGKSYFRVRTISSAFPISPCKLLKGSGFKLQTSQWPGTHCLGLVRERLGDDCGTLWVLLVGPTVMGPSTSGFSNTGGIVPFHATRAL